MVLSIANKIIKKKDGNINNRIINHLVGADPENQGN